MATSATGIVGAQTGECGPQQIATTKVVSAEQNASPSPSSNAVPTGIDNASPMSSDAPNNPTLVPGWSLSRSGVWGG